MSEPVLDPLADLDDAVKAGENKNAAKVGSSRPATLLYTYGPGSVMDLPNFSVMMGGLEAFDRIWKRRPGGNLTIHAPRLLDAVRSQLGPQVLELRPFPWQATDSKAANESRDLGVPARVWPQWLRCTGCDLLAPLDAFTYRNTNPFRPDLAEFVHAPCPGRQGAGRSKSRPANPARYLITCTAGHLDEFPYDAWVHHGKPCAAERPVLRMRQNTLGKGANATIECSSCQKKRGMNEAQGSPGFDKLPFCRGRMPHLDWFDPHGCDRHTHLMLVGASNLWFPVYQSVIVMPQGPAEAHSHLVELIRARLGEDIGDFVALKPSVLRMTLAGVPLDDVSDEALVALISEAAMPVVVTADVEPRRSDPIDLLVPEWQYLLQDPAKAHHMDEKSGLVISKMTRGESLPTAVTRVLAVERLRKVNALLGFTRLDAPDRTGDDIARIAPLVRDRKPTWTIATEDRGEGVFVQLDEAMVSSWEQKVLRSSVWAAHVAAHERNLRNRISETAGDVPTPSSLARLAEQRLPKPRYWLVHTLAHVLMRQMSMQSGYSAASLAERLYAWPAGDGRPAAAGLLITTSASDSDGTLGGLVRLSEAARLERIVDTALRRAGRCSSDPVCGTRTPSDPEDFLHGAACHACAMASETSCERANRFLDRRFLVDLPGSVGLGFFKVDP